MDTIGKEEKNGEVKKNKRGLMKTLIPLQKVRKEDDLKLDIKQKH